MLQIAVVEDDEDSRELLADVLERLGHAVTQAATAAEGEALLALVHVAFIDLGLPDRNGLHLARLARDLAWTPFLVALTGFSDEATRTASRAAGFHAHVVKPLRRRRLTSLLERAAAHAATRP